MKKKFIFIIIGLIVCVVCFFCFVHIYTQPTCTEPAKCKICGKVKGEALGHDFSISTCTEPSVCSRCGLVNQPALGHTYKQITENYRVCTRCGESDGEIYDYESNITCRHVIFYDITDDYTLYSAGADEICYPASTTKLVTAYLALKYLNTDDVITVGNEVYLIGKNSSTAGLKPGYKLTVNDLVKAMLIPSGNDAAYVLALNVAEKMSEETLSQSGYIAYFIQMMNDFAKEQGAYYTHFSTPDGYDDANHFTTPKDMLLLSLKIIENADIKDACSTAKMSKTISSGEKVSWKNSNTLLNSSSSYYCKYATGLKTGSTNFAGKCLIATAEKNDKKFIAIIMGCASDEERYVTADNLFQSVFGD